MDSLLKREVVHVLTGYNRGKEGAILIEKSQNPEDERPTKSFKYFSDPNFHFYKSKEPLEHYQTSVSIDNVERIDCKFSERFYEMAEATGRQKYFQKYEGNFKALRKLNFHKDLHSSDVNLADYLLHKYRKRYKKDGTLFDFALDKSFFDIEVDTIDYEGFPNPLIAPCPINFISYVNRPDKHIKMFVLMNFDRNESQRNFFERNKGDCTNLWSHKNNEYCREALTRLFQDTKDPSNSMEKMTIYWFKSELNLIKKFFDVLHKEKPDFLGGKEILPPV